MTWSQLRRRGLSGATVSRAVAAGRLHEIHTAVYSVIHPDLMTVDAWHAAAVLAGREGACLCGDSAAWWLGLRPDPPQQIHVAVADTRKPIPGVRWHRIALTDEERTSYNRMPTTSPARTPLDLAAGLSLWELKGILAELEFHFGIGPEAVVLRRGYAGSAKLRRAVAEHTPQLARTADELRQRFIHLLVAFELELPDFESAIGLSRVDAVYADQRVVVELDGTHAHSGERRLLRDHRRDLHRRADGFVVLRYHYTQIVSPADQRLVAADLERAGVRRHQW